MDVFAVRNPGPMTTVQDLGRSGFLDRGVPLSGGLDVFACRVANLLVGNSEEEAVLEITLMGPTLEILAAADIALTGADMGMSINGSAAPGWEAIRVSPGDVVRIPQAREGCRAYLAVTGGIDVPPMMGSRSTFVRAKIGGLQGRKLARGDVLPRGARTLANRLRKLPDVWIPRYGHAITLRALPGPEEDARKRGQHDAVQCSYCGEMTYMRDTPLILQSSFKGNHPCCLEEIHRVMRVCLEHTKHVVLLGYSLPADDVIYRAMLSARRARTQTQVYCSVVVGTKGPDEWLTGDALRQFVEANRHDNDFGAETIQAAVDAADADRLGAVLVQQGDDFLDAHSCIGPMEQQRDDGQCHLGVGMASQTCQKQGRTELTIGRLAPGPWTVNTQGIQRGDQLAVRRLQSL